MITAVKWNEFDINFTHDTIFLVQNLQVSNFLFSFATECNYKTNKNVHKTRSIMVHHTLDFRQKKCKFPRILQHLLFYGFDILPTNMPTITICANAQKANDKSLTYHNFSPLFIRLRLRRCYYISDNVHLW